MSTTLGWLDLFSMLSQLPLKSGSSSLKFFDHCNLVADKSDIMLILNLCSVHVFLFQLCPCFCKNKSLSSLIRVLFHRSQYRSLDCDCHLWIATLIYVQSFFLKDFFVSIDTIIALDRNSDLFFNIIGFKAHIRFLLSRLRFY